ncbi:Uncharacterised protein r2_g3400 [Pycnogonum litorale]
MITREDTKDVFEHRRIVNESADSAERRPIKGSGGKENSKIDRHHDYVRKQQLRNDEHNNNNNNPVNYQCNSCGEGFKLLAKLRRHQLSHVIGGKISADNSGNSVENGSSIEVGIKCKTRIVADEDLMRKQENRKRKLQRSDEDIEFHNSIRDRWSSLVTDKISILAFSLQMKRSKYSQVS